MRRRSANDHEASSTMRSEFLSLWDGLLNDEASVENGSVTVLACTNRPFDIDEAFMRRMPRSFFFPLPDAHERETILRLLLSEHELGEGLTAAALADHCAGYSGSDLKELCKAAAHLPLRAILKKHTADHYHSVMMGGAKRSNKEKNNKSRTSSSGATTAAEDEQKDEVSSSSLAAAAASVSSASSASPIAPSISSPPSSAPSSAPATPVLSAASAASASAAVSSLLLTSKPRALTLADFQSAMKSIRPSGMASMRELLAFEAMHRGGAASSSAASGLKEPSSGAESDEEEQADRDEQRDPPGADDDDMYR